MSVQVRVTWRLVGDDEQEITSEFGQAPPIEESADGASERAPTLEQVLEPESSMLASGLALQLA